MKVSRLIWSFFLVFSVSPAMAEELRREVVCIKVTLAEQDKTRLVQVWTDMDSWGLDLKPPFRKELGVYRLLVRWNMKNSFWRVWALPHGREASAMQIQWDRSASREQQGRELSGKISEELGLQPDDSVTVSVVDTKGFVVVVGGFPDPLALVPREPEALVRISSFTPGLQHGYWIYRTDGSGEWFLRTEQREFGERIRREIDDVSVIFVMEYFHP